MDNELDVDWYRYYNNSATSKSVKISFAGTNSSLMSNNCNFAVLSSNYNLLSTGGSGLTYSIPAYGTYYIGVYTKDKQGTQPHPYDNIKNSRSYQLTVTEILPTYILTYEKNTGELVTNMPNQQSTSSGSITISSLRPIRSGYAFLGWSISRMSPPSYMPGDNIVIANNRTLFAVWRAIPGKPSLSITNITSNGFKVSWGSVPNATKYRIRVDNGNWIESSLTERTITATPGTHTVVVHAVNGETLPVFGPAASGVVVLGDLKVYQSVRWPGKSQGATSSTAPDMLINDKNMSQLSAMSGGLLQMAQTYNNNTSIGYGPDWVKSQARNLAAIFSTGDSSMRSVAQNMFDHFLSGTGKDYRSSTLTAKAVAHPSTKQYIENVKTQLVSYLGRNHGNPSTALSFMNGAINYNDELVRPRYPDDLTQGLAICLNDTWGSFVELKNYQSNGTTYSGTLRFTIYDHFGLNDSDVTTGYDGVKGMLVPNMDGFQAWYILQHFTGCKSLYQPFIVYIETEINISGTF